eukprot:5969596-Prymnesium_polylepis.1
MVGARVRRRFEQRTATQPEPPPLRLGAVPCGVCDGNAADRSCSAIMIVQNLELRKMRAMSRLLGE